MISNNTSLSSENQVLFLKLCLQVQLAVSRYALYHFYLAAVDDMSLD